MVDTVAVFPHEKGLPYKKGLKQLAQEHGLAGASFQSGVGGHDPGEDARVVLKLMRKKIGC